MYMDLILESENGYGYDGVSAETMDEIDNIQVPNFTESALSPYDLVSKSLYEFVKENVNMSKMVTNAELNYIKEHGCEPLWEASDSKNIFQKFIDMVKELIGKITGTFDKLMKSVESKVRSIYEKYGKSLNQKIKTDGVHMGDKTFVIRKYEPEYGEMILEDDPMSVLGKTPGYNAIKKAMDYELGTVKSDSAKPYKPEDIKDFSKGIVPNLNKTIFGTIKGIDRIDWSKTSSVKSALEKIMSPEPVRVDWRGAHDEIKYFMNDIKGESLKSKLKTTYKRIKTDLGKIIDETKKSAKKAEKGTGSGSIVGLYINVLNKYIQAMTMTYNTTCRVYNAKWAQSIRINIQIRQAINSGKNQYNKDNKYGRDKDKDVNRFNKAHDRSMKSSGGWKGVEPADDLDFEPKGEDRGMNVKRFGESYGFDDFELSFE